MTMPEGSRLVRTGTPLATVTTTVAVLPPASNVSVAIPPQTARMAWVVDPHTLGGSTVATAGALEITVRSGWAMLFPLGSLTVTVIAEVSPGARLTDGLSTATEPTRGSSGLVPVRQPASATTLTQGSTPHIDLRAIVSRIAAPGIGLVQVESRGTRSRSGVVIVVVAPAWTR